MKYIKSVMVVYSDHWEQAILISHCAAGSPPTESMQLEIKARNFLHTMRTAPKDGNIQAFLKFIGWNGARTLKLSLLDMTMGRSDNLK